MRAAKGAESMEQGSEPRALYEMIAGKWISSAIYAAVELAIPDILKNGPCTDDEIARVAGASGASVSRLLRALVSLGLLTRQPGGRFALTPMGDYLRSDVPGSLRGWARFVGHELTWLPWGNLVYSIRTGQPAFDQVFGMRIFDYIGHHPEVASVLNDAMTSISITDADAVAQAYDFSGVGTLVDVGGGHGLLLTTLLKVNPHMRGILFELPHAIDGAKALLQRERIADRCEVVSGDFFQSIPEGGDAYILKLVIHDWDDDRATQILRNCHVAMRPTAKLLLVERVLSPGNQWDLGKFVDLEMLVLTAGGRERTEAEFREIYARAGFALTRIVPAGASKCVIEGMRL